MSLSNLTDFERFDEEEAICCLQAFGERNDACVIFEYLSKGAANVVFRIRAPQESTDNEHLFAQVHKLGNAATIILSDRIIGHVLRVSRGKAKHLTVDEIMAGFEHAVRPVFLPGKLEAIVARDTSEDRPDTYTQVTIQLDRDLTSHLMDHERCLLFPGVLDHLASLTEQDTFLFNRDDTSFQARKNKGILLPDMSPVPGTSVTLEVKPKWLMQSPTAPSEARRCRTCAMQIAVPKDRDKYICPLKLVNGDQPDINSWVHSMVRSHFESHADLKHLNEPELVASIAKRLVDYLVLGQGRVLLRHMQFLQQNLDAQGVLYQNKVQPKNVFDHNLRLAMTLRDCSLFVKIPYDGAKIISKLGDLDFKSAEKFDDWQEKEERLLIENLYTKDTVDAPECWLSPMEDKLKGRQV